MNGLRVGLPASARVTWELTARIPPLEPPAAAIRLPSHTVGRHEDELQLTRPENLG